MSEIDSAAFEAGEAPCDFSQDNLSASGSSTAAHFSDPLGRVYVTARARMLSARPQAGHTQPALTLVVEDSADGSSWATIATFDFTASDQQSAAVDSPRAYLRASWADVVGTWAVDVAVKSIATPASGGGSLPYALVADSPNNYGVFGANHLIPCDGANHTFACPQASPPEWLDTDGNIILPGLYQCGAWVKCSTDPTTPGLLMQVRGTFMQDWPVPLDAMPTTGGNLTLTDFWTLLPDDLPWPTTIGFSMPTDDTGIVRGMVFVARLASASA